ncbi:3'-5' exoribonuclease YhaM family protein [Hippea maritima]|uniref:Metal dependent phosphohydrolase n=1 Tax=Hippea maritima (strain ATCC 700847 / DSM 10411 / MH2) TaxID=760142 RepID=F2LWP4_HIPMA|nr:HD domain-containing protein [Hippea maritima]AEA33022.1 metal dependent phosphohydrolase [Hippea maritima DSM 10411]
MYDCIEAIKQRKLKKIEGEAFLVSEKHILKARNGDEYVGLKLKDRTGIIDAKIWNNLLHLKDRFEAGDFVKIRGESNYYNDNWQVIIKDLERLDEKEVDKSAFLPSTKKDISKLQEELLALIDSLKHVGLKKLLEEIFLKEDFLEKFSKAPAAKTMHHAYVGGLIEHTVSVGKIASELSEEYPGIDRDLLVSCALLHDIGKVYELDPTTFNYTTEGKLIGHIVIGYTLVQNAIDKLNVLSEEKKLNLLHCILAHHGEYEYGSPKKPKTKEAVLINMIDVLDSRMQPVLDVKVDENTGWSDMVRIIGKSIYAPKSSKELL